MFDSSKEFVVKIVSGGVKSCLLRYPSDSQWADRARRQKVVRHFIGRGKTKSSDFDTGAIDLELLKQLRVEPDGEQFDAAEASAFIGRLDRAEVVSAEWQGNTTRQITLKVPGATTVHVLNIPKQADTTEHERATSDEVYGNRSAEIRFTIEPSGRLYDKLHVSHEGYAGAVPINHKVAAITNLLASLSSLLDEEEEDPEG